MNLCQWSITIIQTYHSFLRLLRKEEKVAINLFFLKTKKYLLNDGWDPFTLLLIHCWLPCDTTYNHRFLEQILFYKYIVWSIVKISVHYIWPSSQEYLLNYSQPACSASMRNKEDNQEAPSTALARCRSSVKHWLTFFPAFKNLLPL